jgi:hypothetical protein
VPYDLQATSQILFILGFEIQTLARLKNRARLLPQGTLWDDPVQLV